MSKVSMSGQFPVSPDQIWETIGRFAGLHDWHPAVESSETEGDGVGSVRKLHLAGGGTILEKLESIDDGERVYSYSIVDSPLPVSGYKSTLRVRDGKDGTGSMVEWSSEFQASGASENDAVKVIEGIYEAGLANLRKMFGV